MLMGRYTYEAHAGAWPGRGGDYADRINAMPEYVASTTLKAPAWSNTYVLEGDLGEAVTRLRQKPDHNILMHGYGPVAKTLARQGLLDELHLGSSNAGWRRRTQRRTDQRRSQQASLVTGCQDALLGRGNSQLSTYLKTCAVRAGPDASRRQAPARRSSRCVQLCGTRWSSAAYIVSDPPCDDTRSMRGAGSASP